jgi:hypothetical protein
MENIKFNRKVAKDPANIDTILLNLMKKRKLI